MTLTPFPGPRPGPIGQPDEIAAIEATITALAGLITATGGAVAVAGRDLFATPVMERARLLSAMYDAGEVVFGWRDGRDGAVANVALVRLAAADGRVCWRADVYVEEAAGHVLRGALADPTPQGLGRRLLQAAGEGLAAPLPSPGAAVAQALRGADS